MSSQYTAIVIGAGISGLAAAARLSAQGHRVRVLEAQPRAGGRIWTAQMRRCSVELGGAWLHGIERNPLRSLIEQLGLSLIENHYDYHDALKLFDSCAMYHPGGKVVTDKEMRYWRSLLESFFGYIESHPEHTYVELIQQFVQIKRLDTPSRRLINYGMVAMINYEYAANLDQLSSHSDSAYDLSKEYGANALLRPGMQTLITYLAKGLIIDFQTRVTAINFTQPLIRICTEQGSYSADKVIITVPLGVLQSKKIDFHPSLPLFKQQAIEQLGMGLYNKIILRFDSVFWDNKEWLGCIASSEDEGTLIYNQNEYLNDQVLIVFTSGRLAQAIERLDDRQSIDWALAEIAKLYPEAQPNLVDYAVTRWGGNPDFLGSYSYLPHGVPKQHYQSMAAAIEDRVYFAGEATALESPSTIHGAYLSGLRVADQISNIMEE